MAGRDRGRAGDKAVAYLAIAFVIMVGVGFGSFSIVIFSPNPVKAFLMLGAGVLGLLALIWFLRDNKEGGSLLERYRGLFGVKRKKEKVKIKVKRVKTSRPVEETQGPPTVERVRELSAGSNTWVPTGRPRRSDEDS